MPISPDDFVKNNVDVGAVITEGFLNRFTTAHHNADKDVYEGTQVVTIFEPKMEIKYDVRNPIVFDLSPIPESKFKSVWINHLRQKGAGNLKDNGPLPIPPNLKISVSDARFTFIVYKPGDKEIDFEVTFDWDIEGTCAVELLEEQENVRSIRLESIKVVISKHPDQLKKEIRQALIEVAQKKGIKEDKNKGEKTTRFLEKSGEHPIWQLNDPEKLILYLINQILALQMTNFIQEFELPRAIELIENKEDISPNYLTVTEKTLAVGAQFHAVDLALPPGVEAQVQVFLDSLKEQFDKEFRTLQYQNLKEWQPENSPSLLWLNEKQNEIDALISQRSKEYRNVGEVYPENIQLFINDKLFNDLAKSYLNYSDSQEYKAELLKILRAECGWSVNVDNASTKIITGGLEAHVDIEVKGWARVGCPNPDPKHWGEWIWLGLGVGISPDPNFGIQVVPTFESDGIYIQGNLLTQKLKVTFSGLPKWANDALGWLTSWLTVPPLAVIRYIVSLLHVKIIDYPSEGIPGTGLMLRPEDWRFNRDLVNSGPYLVLTADTQFSEFQ